MTDLNDVVCRLDNGNVQHYKIVANTAFEFQLDLKTGEIEDYSGTVNDRLINVLLDLIYDRRRVRVWYGDTQTGRSWNEEFQTKGYIGRSTGNLKVPLIVSNSRSFGGGALSVGCLVRIDDIESHRTLWKVDNFHVEPMKITTDSESDYKYKVMQKRDGESDFTYHIASFKKEEQAKRYIQFMNGERYCK